jgi:hypothetical protein
LTILIAGYFIAKALAKLVARVLTRLGFDQLAERGGIKTALAHSLSGMPYANVLGNLAWGFILALGIIAALNQLHIAQNVLNAVLYAALAVLAGIAIVAVGGGASRQCPSGGRLSQPGTTRKSCASSAP